MNEDIINRMDNGDPLSDKEVVESFRFFSALERDLLKLGPTFEFARRDCCNRAQKCRRWHQARTGKWLKFAQEGRAK